MKNLHMDQENVNDKYQLHIVVSAKPSIAVLTLNKV